MLNRTRPVALAAAALATLVSVGCDLEAQLATVNGSFERTLQVGGPVDLTLRNGAGDIRVAPGTDRTVHVVGHIRARESMMSSLSAAERVKRLEAGPPIAQQGDTVRIGEITDDDLRSNLRIDYEITVPANTVLHSRTGSGDQEIGAIQGPVDITAGSGDLSIGPVSAGVRIKTGSGGIELRGASGDIDMTAASGDIRATDVAGAVRIRTASGDIDVEGRPTADWSIGAASGDVSVRVPQDAAFTLAASTGSGAIRTNLPLDAESRSRRELDGRVRGGGPQLKITTASGSIHVD
jgi:DUF4097 and DUF4098 domain-containing protein YvlB